MGNSKLAELLKGISRYEYKKFGVYLNSPFFNKSKRIIKLYNYFKENSSKGKACLSKVSIWKYLYPNKRYDDWTLRALISKFVRLIEDFLVRTSPLCKLTCQKTILSEELRLRGAHKCFKTEAKSLLSYYKFNKLLVESDYKDLIELEDLAISSDSEKSKVIDDVRIGEVLKIIDFQFIYSKLHSCNLLLMKKSPLPMDYEIEGRIINEIMDRMGNESESFEKENKLIFMEYIILNMLIKFQNLKYMKLLFNFLKENYKQLDFIVLSHIFNSFNAWYSSISNYCSDEKCHLKMFDVIKFYDDVGFFDKYKSIPPKIFYTLIETSIEVEKSNFAEIFYCKYIYKVDRQTDRDFLFLSKVIININHKNFETAIDKLNEMSLKDSETYLYNKSYLAQVYYETKEIEPLNYLIDATKHYLNRHKVNIGLRYSRFFNFFNYLYQLTNLSEYRDLINLKKLMIGIQPIFEKKWLLEMIKILENQH